LENRDLSSDLGQQSFVIFDRGARNHLLGITGDALRAGYVMLHKPIETAACVDVTAWYWHFMDLLWIYIFALLVRAIEKIKDDEDDRRGPILCDVAVHHSPAMADAYEPSLFGTYSKKIGSCCSCSRLIDLRSAAMASPMAGLDAARPTPFHSESLQCDGRQHFADQFADHVSRCARRHSANARRNACGCWRPWLAASRL